MSPIKANIKRQHRRSGKAGTEQPLREIRNDVAGIDIVATENYIGCRTTKRPPCATSSGCAIPSGRARTTGSAEFKNSLI